SGTDTGGTNSATATSSCESNLGRRRWQLRRNVLVHPESVFRIVLAFEADEPLVFLRVVCSPNPFGSLVPLGPEVIDVHAAGCERLHCTPKTPGPRDVCFVFRGIGPDRRDDQVEPRVSMAEGRVPFPDAGDRTAYILEPDLSACPGHALRVADCGDERLFSPVGEQA